MSSDTDEDSRTIVFFHPDLGIGGAERLVVDAAVGLKQRGHKVVIFTSHCDPNHCFEECRDGTLDVRVRGNYLFPPSILSRLTILFAMLRQLHLLVHIYLTGELGGLKPSSFIVDQLSAGIPLLQYLVEGPRILFYCHYPDLLLARGRSSPLKRLYRAPFDWLERWSMGYAHAIAVNSEFTKGVVMETWPGIEKEVELRVVHPCIKLDEGMEAKMMGRKLIASGEGEGADDVVWPDEKVILSINRFERKKDVGLVIKAFAAIPEKRRKDSRLIIAGGYDPRVSENVEYHKDLISLATSLGLQTFTAKTVITALSAPADAPVLFLLSVPTSLKDGLLRSARLVAYTPAREHFGIVPLEAMLAGVPVLAADSGGPRESVRDGETGWLRDPDDVAAWTAVLDRVLNDTTAADRLRMGKAGMSRVRNNFGRPRMAEKMERILDDMDSLLVRPPLINPVLNFVGIFVVFGVGIWVSSMYGKARRMYPSHNPKR